VHIKCWAAAAAAVVVVPADWRLLGAEEFN